MQHTPTHRKTATVVVIGVEGNSLGHIRECLNTEAAIPNENVQYADASAAVRRHRPQVVIVGFDANPDAAIALGRAGE